MVKTENFEKVEVQSATQLRDWLFINHTQKESIWLVTFKKHIADKYISISEVLDELLCFGWIDGIRRKLDEEKTMQLISPRQTQHWAQTYKVRFAKLEKKGLVADAGKASVTKSKENGSWNFMYDVDALIKPPDFIKCLEENHPAMVHFDKFGASSQRFILRWIKLSKTPETRAKRIKHASELAAKNLKISGL